jgi:hypothetical protein
MVKIDYKTMQLKLTKQGKQKKTIVKIHLTID